MTAESIYGERLVALAEWMEFSALGVWIGESRYMYALLEGAHLIGLAAAVGFLFTVDMRLLGWIFRDVRVRTLTRQLRPWIFWSFGVIFATGILLFWSSAVRMLDSPAFAIKTVLLFVGLANAIYFELVSARTPAIRENRPVLPGRVRFAAALSLSVWTLTIAAGRMTAYMPHWS